MLSAVSISKSHCQLDPGTIQTAPLDILKLLQQHCGLVQVMTAAFEDAATMTATFKLLDSFEGLLEREAIAQVQLFCFGFSPFFCLLFAGCLQWQSCMRP